MRHWEINGNLDDENTGIPNYGIFQREVVRTKELYDEVFGRNLIDQIDFYVDNATRGSGYTPVSTVVLGKIVVIKLGIEPGASSSNIVFQFAHELTHVIIMAYYGINKPRANDEEEMICTAASLIAIKELHPKELDNYQTYVENLSIDGYRRGAQYAREIKYNFEELKLEIEKLYR